MRYLLEHNQVDLVYSDLQIIDDDSRPVGITRAQPFDINTIIFSNYINQPTVFMRKQVIQELGGVNEELHFVMDRELWLRAGTQHHFVYLQDQVLANFRLCKGTKSYDNTPAFRAEWLQVLEHTINNPAYSIISPKTRQSALQQTIAQYHGALMIKSIEQRERKKMFKHLIQATIHDPSLLTNRGTWLFAGKGLLGLDIDRLRKYRK